MKRTQSNMKMSRNNLKDARHEAFNYNKIAVPFGGISLMKQPFLGN